ncbi:hypothetical protein BDD12DRAFT_873752 [Trichophaea hybrida]|nr:hypothetical protein BDD12DRAFT_873752 [Trichophaea hybrida]
MSNSNSSDTLAIPGSYSIDNILYVRNPNGNGTLEPLLSASGAYLSALIVPDAPLLTKILAVEKLAAKKKTEEAIRKASFRCWWKGTPRPLVREDEEPMQGMQ